MGMLGAALHLIVLLTLFYGADSSFVIAQGSAVIVAMTANFFFNNLFTYRDRRLRGARILRGLVVFYLTCAAGAAINLMVATYLFDRGIHVAAAGLLGAAVGAIWNYTLSSEYAWRVAKA
jgi:dolichol-phosphate mannosyltransferase